MSNLLQSLVSISPVDVLTFELARDTAPETILRVTNISNGRVAFKVKTTQPTWYYVRPNQQVLEVGKSEDVRVVLVEAECNRFLEQGEGAHKTIATHRFLVQSRPIDDATFDQVSEGSSSQKAAAFANFWESSPKDDRKNHKLKVDFVGPNTHKPLDTVHEEGMEIESPIAANVETIRRKINPEDEGTAVTQRDGAIVGSPEALLAELQSLRKKYDAIVEYTVHLTAERDYHFSQSEEKRNAEEKLRDKSKRKSTDGSKSKGGDKQFLDKKVTGPTGFSPMVLIAVAFISFLLGRWVKF